jgi:putative NADPH-quinone reductase
MTFLGTNMLADWTFLIFALAVGDERYTKKARPTNNKLRHNTRQLIFVIVGISVVRIFVMGCSCHDKSQPVTQSVCARPT